MIGRRGKRNLGRILILDADSFYVDKLDVDRLDIDRPISMAPKRSIEDLSIDYIGAMGTRAKMLAQKEGIELDFTYGVLDKSILRALNGKSCLIMTTGGMVDHVAFRIEEYARESGTSIEVERLMDRRQSF